MKELSIEEKAKHYDEALKVLHKYDGANIMFSQSLKEEMFPELKESEDERIRKDLIIYLRSVLSNKKYGDKFIESWIAWLENIPYTIDHEKREGFHLGYKAALEKQGEPNPYSGVSFKYNGHTWGMCARDNGVEILIDGQLKGRVFAEDTNAKEMFIKALERVEEQTSKGYKLTDCDKNSWWEDFKAYTTSEQNLTNSCKSCKDEQKILSALRIEKGKWYMCLHPSKGFVKGRCYKANGDGSIEGDNAYIYVGDDPTDFRLATELEIRGDVGECAV